MESISRVLPVHATRSAAPRVMTLRAMTVKAVTSTYEGTVMPFAGRVRGTALLDVDGPAACAPPD